MNASRAKVTLFLRRSICLLCVWGVAFVDLDSACAKGNPQAAQPRCRKSLWALGSNVGFKPNEATTDVRRFSSGQVGHNPELMQAYQAYERGMISRFELESRLPSIAVFGDSLNKRLHLSSIPGMLWQIHTRNQGNGVLNTSDKPGEPRSLFQELSRAQPIHLKNYSVSSGDLFDTGYRGRFVRWLFRFKSLSEQFDEMFADPRPMPDLIAILLGANNLFRVADTTTSAGNQHMEQIAVRAYETTVLQLRRIVTEASHKETMTAVVICGLVDFESFFRMRERLEAEPPVSFRPEIAYRWFPSIRPENRQHLLAYASSFNEALERAVLDVTSEIQADPDLSKKLLLHYSDRFSKAALLDPGLLDPIDGFHLSPNGHNEIAYLWLDALAPAFKHLHLRHPSE